jgi:hypothetical protein
MTKLLTTYCISITRYLVVLYWIWCSYHNYVKKAIRVRILWHHGGPFGLLLGHSSYFFLGVKPSFSGSTSYPRLFKMLGFDRIYTSFSFLIGWSPYSFWCGGTCKDWYLSLLGCITRYPCVITWSCLITCLAFRKSNSVVLSSNVIFFDGPTTQARIYFPFNRCSFECCANMYSLMCRSSNKGFVFNLF